MCNSSRPYDSVTETSSTDDHFNPSAPSVTVHAVFVELLSAIEEEDRHSSPNDEMQALPTSTILQCKITLGSNTLPKH